MKIASSKKSLVADRSGIARLIEFLMVFTVFLIIVGGFYAMVNIYRPAIMDYTQEDTIRLGEVLICQPGEPDDWETKDVKLTTALGLAINSTTCSKIREDNQSYGILYQGKIDKLHELRNNLTAYEIILDKAGIKEKGYNMNITFTNLTDNNKYYFGDETAGIAGFCWKRIVLVYDNENYTQFAFELRLAKRG